MVDEIGLVEDNVLDNSSFDKSMGLATQDIIRNVVPLSVVKAVQSVVKHTPRGMSKPALPLGQSLVKVVKADSSVRQIRVLYLFAGEKRKNDLREKLVQVASRSSIEIVMKEVDLLRHGSEDDVLEDKVWYPILDSLARGDWDYLIAAPPCGDFSRAKWANKSGPRPRRSRQYPRGFPWLRGKSKDATVNSNIMVDRAVAAIKQGMQSQAKTRWLLEHPEDLGDTANGGEPASIWQFEEIEELERLESVVFGVLYQCRFPEALHAKPTRLMGTVKGLGKMLYLGRPRFTKNSHRYIGPLPRNCGHVSHKSLIGVNSEGVFNTAGAAAYPDSMNEEIAEHIVEDFSVNVAVSNTLGMVSGSAGSSGDSSVPRDQFWKEVARLTLVKNDHLEADSLPWHALVAERDTSDEDEEGISRTKLGSVCRGRGDPPKVVSAGRQLDFHDGAGLCSSGRWHPADRIQEPTGLAARLLLEIRRIVTGLNYKRIVAELACGKCTKCPFDAATLSRAMDKWTELLLCYDPSLESVALDCSGGISSFEFRRIGHTLRLLGDPDWRIWSANTNQCFETGVFIGVRNALPRVPAVFERKRKWRNYDDALESGIPYSKENYKSLAPIASVIQVQFEEEEALGMMRQDLNSVAEAEYGMDLQVAALAAIRKEDDTFRVIFDGTHGVKVNPRIVCRDQIRFAGVPEQRVVMTECMERQTTTFAMKADVSKAHRRVAVKRCDQGWQCCRLSPDKLWINEVGTFGVASASYWWSRMYAGTCRLSVLVVASIWQLVFADDVNWVVRGPDLFVDLLSVILWQIMMGVPFAWHKFRGGSKLEWIGYYLDYSKFAIGISEGRSMWLVRWIKDVLAAGAVHVGELEEVLGRFAFASAALWQLRPWLGPMYAWVAAVPRSALLSLPIMIRLILRFIHKMFEHGATTAPLRIVDKKDTVRFYADAMASDVRVGIGGYEFKEGRSLMDSPWYAEEVSEEVAPWLYEKGKDQTFRYIATLELLGTLACVRLFGDQHDHGGALITMSGSTDNLGNSYVVHKLMTTKFPLCVILMQLCLDLNRKGAALDLDWVRRDNNQIADDLSNGIVKDFSPQHRKRFIISDLVEMEELRREGKDMYEALTLSKSARKAEDGSSRGRKRPPEEKLKEAQPWR